MTDHELDRVREIVRAEVRMALARLLLAVGLTGTVLAVGVAMSWATVTANQETIAETLASWRRTAPAPAESTRTALQSLDRRVGAVEEDVRNLRRDLRRPR